jgi:ketosteroid isomerase-like protein
MLVVVTWWPATDSSTYKAKALQKHKGGFEMSADGGRIAEEYVAGLLSRDLERIASVLADDVVYEDVPAGEQVRGRQEMLDAVRDFLASAPDLKVEARSVFGSGDLGAFEGSSSGTAEGKSLSER